MNVKRILIDCSDTYIYNLQTGIQRVVRNIVERKDLIEKILGVPVLPVVLTNWGYISLDDFLQSKPPNKNKKSIKSKIQYFFTVKLNNDFIYSSVKLFWYIYKKIYYILFNWLSVFIKKPKNIINLSNGDLVLFIDAFWQPVYSKNKNFFKMISNAKAQNVIFAVLVHDIIPITNPEFWDSIFASKFKTSFERIVSYSNFILATSQSEKNNVEYFLKSLRLQKPIDYFYLGCDLSKQTESEYIRESIKQLKTKTYFLMVGTIEPRKGYDVALEAFERLWQNGFEKDLVIVGKIGWGVKKTVNRFLNSKYYNKKLFMFNDANDTELDFLYKNTQALIFASKREGFGLPLVEAMQYKKPIIASDIDVFKEIGKDYPVYFKCNDPQDLINAVLKFQGDSEVKDSRFKPLTWDESVQLMCDRIKELMKNAG